MDLFQCTVCELTFVLPVLPFIAAGVDVTKSDFSDLWFKQDLSITVADWSSSKVAVRSDLDNSAFLHLSVGNFTLFLSPRSL